MIRRVLTEEDGKAYLERVAGAFCLGPAMEVRYRLFGNLPQLGHQFWLSDTAVLALAGNTASVLGEYDPDEMGAFLDFTGSERLLTDQSAPFGWELAETLYGYAVRQPLPVDLPAGVTLDAAPPMLEFSRLAMYGKEEERIEGFYAQSCAKRNHGMGEFWMASLNGTAVSAVAASEIANGQAYMSQGHTLPGHRGQGIGGALIASMANSLLARGITPGWLCREERCHFYEGMGAVLEKEYYMYKKKE